MGFGRVGRNLFRIASKEQDVVFGAISDIANHEALSYLLRFDSIYGRFPEPVRLDDGHLHVRAQRIPMLDGREPGDVPWGDYGVDVVVEATSRNRSRAELQKHLDAGAKRVVVCVPQRDEVDLTLIRGVNDDALTADHKIVSVGSCTANAVTPVLRVIDENFGIEKAFMYTAHSYTNEQRVADVPHEDIRRSRAAAENIIPTESNAAKTIAKAYPALDGKLSTLALAVPVPDGSVADITLKLKTKASAEEINAAIYRRVVGKLRGVVGYQDEPIVSKDVIQNPCSGVFDSLATMSGEDGLMKCLVWFDTSWGYANRVLEVSRQLASLSLEKTP